MRVVKDNRTQRLSATYSPEDRKLIEDFAEEKGWDVATLIRRGVEAMMDPSVAVVRFDQPIAEALTVIAQEKEWDLNTLVRAAVKVQYPDVFKK